MNKLLKIFIFIVGLQLLLFFSVKISYADCDNGYLVTVPATGYCPPCINNNPQGSGTIECSTDGVTNSVWVYHNVGEGTCQCGACFLSGTKVATPGGEKAIEKVAVGDKVMSFDPLTQKQSVNTVADNFVRSSGSYYTIKTASGKEVKATGEHPFYVGKEIIPLTILAKVENLIKTGWRYFRLGIGIRI